MQTPLDEIVFAFPSSLVLAYNDSNGWYDHQLAPLVNHSQSDQDALTGVGECGQGGPKLGGEELRPGYGPRLPLLVISPYSKVNSVDSTLTDQTSILRFVVCRPGSTGNPARARRWCRPSAIAGKNYVSRLFL